MTDDEAGEIYKWAEKLCKAQTVTGTPYLSAADHRQQGKVWTAAHAAHLWKCQFAHVKVKCNYKDQLSANRLLVVPTCRRAILAGYTPCSTHMWTRDDTTNEDRSEIVQRWAAEKLTKRLVAVFATQEAKDDNNERAFVKVRRLLALYLFVSAITVGTQCPPFDAFRKNDPDDFREIKSKTINAFFVKHLNGPSS